MTPNLHSLNGKLTVLEFLASRMSRSADFKSSWMASPPQFRKELRWSWTFTHILSIICSKPSSGWHVHPHRPRGIQREGNAERRTKTSDWNFWKYSLQPSTNMACQLTEEILEAWVPENHMRCFSSLLCLHKGKQAEQRGKLLELLGILWLLSDIFLGSVSPSLSFHKYLKHSGGYKERNETCHPQANAVTTTPSSCYTGLNAKKIKTCPENWYFLKSFNYIRYFLHMSTKPLKNEFLLTWIIIMLASSNFYYSKASLLSWIASESCLAFCGFNIKPKGRTTECGRQRTWQKGMIMFLHEHTYVVWIWVVFT